MTLTLKQVRDWHRRQARACAPFEAEQAQSALHDDMADAINAHLAGMGYPVGWIFQHEETGRMSFCENDGVNNAKNFAKNNPRHVLCSPAFTAPPIDLAAVRKVIAEMNAPLAPASWPVRWRDMLEAAIAMQSKEPRT